MINAQIMRGMEYLVAIAFVLILGSLAAALGFMRQGQKRGERQRMVRALAWRVGLSIALFASILLAYKLGYIQPTGISFSH